MLRGAISGFGEVAARAHLVGWKAHPDVQIVAIHDPVAARRHAAINLIKNIRVYDDLDLMLDGEKLDFLDIASPPAYHAATASRAVEAGAHVLIEKPLCLERKVLVELVHMAAQASRVLMCVHNWKHAPAYRRAHELVASGRLGAVTRLSLDRLRDGPAGQGSSAGGERWRRDAQSGGGILIDHGWHVFYLMQWLMDAPPLTVAAELGYQPGSNVDDFARVRIDFASGTADAHLSWRAAKRATTARIDGAEGLLSIDGTRLELRTRDGNLEDCSVADVPDDSYHPSWFAGMAAEFVRAIEQRFGGPAMAENIAEAENAVAVIEAARKSSQLGGSRVSINE
jgi:predicted dehydrogenase